jgi:hypothetical protein
LWPELLDEMQAVLLEVEIADPRKDPKDLLRSANDIYDCFAANDLLDTHYYSFLYNRFAPIQGQSLDLQNVLLTLPFCGIATTNWDVCFESAIKSAWPDRAQSFSRFSIHRDHPNSVRPYFDSLWRGTEANSVAHFHGVYDDAREIIVTAKQYEEAYGVMHEEIGRSRPAKSLGKWTLLRKTVWALMTTQRVIFVGFGMSDPFLYALFSYVGAELWDKTGRVHFLITGISQDTTEDPQTYRGRLRRELGVQSIFYEVQCGNHSRMMDLLYELGANPGGAGHGQPPISELLGPI